MRLQCQRCRKSFTASRTDARYCGPRCRVAVYRARRLRVPPTDWRGRVPTMRVEKHTLGKRLLQIAEHTDDGAAKTGRRYFYLTLSHRYITADMSATEAGKKSRDAAYHKVLDVLGVLRMSGKLPWDMVLDLTRELEQWEVFSSPREARAAMRESYDEDRWLGQPYYPVHIVEKDTMEPVCRPLAMRWQMPFASSRGYSSLTLQHEVANMLRERQVRYGQEVIVYFVSDLDPSGIDLQRAWEEALANFGVAAHFERIALTPEQVALHRLHDLSIEVKASDSRSRHFIADYGNRCWEVDVLPASVIERAIERHIRSWLDGEVWQRRLREIERARGLL
jgi:hypothetical protein